jgi:hypothetical protein
VKLQPAAVIKQRFATATFYVIGLAGLTVGGLFVVKPLFDQIRSWLKEGRAPARDVYWFLADPVCAATAWRARGWQGMDLCRETYIHFTDWVGLDMILNYLCGFHVAIFGAVAAFILLVAAAALDDIYDLKRL